jgi:hypothetical protein
MDPVGFGTFDFGIKFCHKVLIHFGRFQSFRMKRMKNPFRKNISPTQVTGSAGTSNRAQMAWSLFVAAAIAAMIVHQTMASHPVQHASPLLQTNSAPQTLVTEKPVPLSQQDFKTTTETSLQ